MITRRDVDNVEQLRNYAHTLCCDVIAYGRHTPFCKWHILQEDATCSCGYAIARDRADAIIKQIDAAATSAPEASEYSEPKVGDVATCKNCGQVIKFDFFTVSQSRPDWRHVFGGYRTCSRPAAYADPAR